ncbi:soma ferritin-like [Cimex lectularius]|uniref:Ferritin n=1 Tax=Cimex lectularius TaxID=79782 RepID=A0A8I6RDH3_CIMLE|nr:soma ferritin-like [Cimex lectularius]
MLLNIYFNLWKFNPNKLSLQNFSKQSLLIQKRKRSSSDSNKCSNEVKASATRYNFHEECEKAINDQINKELSAGYLYLNMASVFSHDTIALPGFHAMFSFNAKDEVEHAMKLVHYQNLRGGRLKLYAIQPPEEEIWNPTSAVTISLNTEKNVLDSLIKVAEKGNEHGDINLEDFITTQFLPEQYEALKFLGSLLAQIKRVQDGEGLFMLDLDLLKTYRKKIKK